MSNCCENFDCPQCKASVLNSETLQKAVDVMCKATDKNGNPINLSEGAAERHSGYAVTDRRASQQPEPERHEQAMAGILASTMAGIAMSQFGDSSRVDPARARAMQERYDHEMQPYRSSRKRKNKAARKARRANR